MRIGVLVNRHNDPRKNDPTKQDERDNDHTRIRQEPSIRKHPETPAAPPEEPETAGPAIVKIREAKEETVRTESPGKLVEEPAKKNSEHQPGKNEPHKKNNNEALQGKKENDSVERDDEGNAVL